MAKKKLTIIKPKKKKLIIINETTKLDKENTELTNCDIDEEEEEDYMEDSDMEESDIEKIDIEESSNYIFNVADNIEEPNEKEVNIIVPKSKIDKSSLIDIFKTTELTKEQYNY